MKIKVATNDLVIWFKGHAEDHFEHYQRSGHRGCASNLSDSFLCFWDHREGGGQLFWEDKHSSMGKTFSFLLHIKLRSMEV